MIMGCDCLMIGLSVRDMIRNLLEYNMEAEFILMGDDGLPIPISDFNVGWENGGDSSETERNILLEKRTCNRLVLFPNNNHEKEKELK